MPHGRALRVVVETMHEFGELVDTLRPDEALAAGSLRHDLPTEVYVVTKRKLNGAARPDVIARSQEYIVYREGVPALALIDYDAKGNVAGGGGSAPGGWRRLECAAVGYPRFGEDSQGRACIDVCRLV